jgi:hypothetical protein
VRGRAGLPVDRQVEAGEREEVDLLLPPLGGGGAEAGEPPAPMLVDGERELVHGFEPLAACGERLLSAGDAVFGGLLDRDAVVIAFVVAPLV